MPLTSKAAIKAQDVAIDESNSRMFNLRAMKYVAGGATLKEQKAQLALVAGTGPIDTAGATVLLTQILDNSSSTSAVTNAQTSTFIDNATLADQNSNGNGGRYGYP